MKVLLFRVGDGGLGTAGLICFDFGPRRTAELLLQLISERARQEGAAISEAFAEMHEKLQEQPKDIEKLCVAQCRSHTSHTASLVTLIEYTQ